MMFLFVRLHHMIMSHCIILCYGSIPHEWDCRGQELTFDSCRFGSMWPPIRVLGELARLIPSPQCQAGDSPQIKRRKQKNRWKTVFIMRLSGFIKIVALALVESTSPCPATRKPFRMQLISTDFDSSDPSYSFCFGLDNH